MAAGCIYLGALLITFDQPPDSLSEDDRIIVAIIREFESYQPWWTDKFHICLEDIEGSCDSLRLNQYSKCSAFISLEICHYSARPPHIRGSEHVRNDFAQHSHLAVPARIPITPIALELTTPFLRTTSIRLPLRRFRTSTTCSCVSKSTCAKSSTSRSRAEKTITRRVKRTTSG